MTKAKAKKPKAKGTARGRSKPASGQVREPDGIEMVPLSRLRPARVNDRIYKPIDPFSDQIQAEAKELKATIDRFGIRKIDPWLVSLDNVIVSGHRRRGMLLSLGLDDAEVPVNRLPIRSSDPDFETHLVRYNSQRVKSVAETIREQVIRTSPDDAHNALLAHRQVEATKVYRRVLDAGLRTIDPVAARARSEITAAKRPMLDAAIGILEQYREYWPLTLRQIHYRMLTRNVLRNSTKPETYTRMKKGQQEVVNNKYANNHESYKDLSDLLTRARLAGEVPWESMHDPTRPRTEWRQAENVAEYMRAELDGFLTGYKRNLLQSQPAYVELVVEKITAQDIVERAAARYHVPVGVGRGYSSVTSLDETAERFRASGKDQFVLLIAGDFDPEAPVFGVKCFFGIRPRWPGPTVGCRGPSR